MLWFHYTKDRILHGQIMFQILKRLMDSSFRALDETLSSIGSMERKPTQLDYLEAAVG
jgi:hypothetical protein